MRTVDHPAGAAGPLRESERIARLETLLRIVETLESDEPLERRVARALELVAGTALWDACGVVGLGDEALRLETAVEPGLRDAARAEAERAAASGKERHAPWGDGELIALPLRAEERVEGALWMASPRLRRADRALAHDIADRLARTAAAERARLRRLAQAAELRRRDALKTALLHGVSHEMRTPLTGIANAADALGVIDDPRERAEILRAVIGETQRLERVVTNLLDMSRVDGGVLTARMEWCVPEELIGSALQASQGFLGGVEVVTEIAGDAPLVRADPVLTERIMVNLLHNAVRHGAPPVRVAGRTTPAGLELSVCDAGPGVDPRVLPSVFEPFIHREGVGLGLGLPLCRRLAEAQEARLEHRPGPGGRGACFAVAFQTGRPPRIGR
jgi:two-component system, OmpR family, sensor histidine kinase KdpD